MRTGTAQHCCGTARRSQLATQASSANPSNGGGSCAHLRAPFAARQSALDAERRDLQDEGVVVAIGERENGDLRRASPSSTNGVTATGTCEQEGERREHP